MPDNSDILVKILGESNDTLTILNSAGAKGPKFISENGRITIMDILRSLSHKKMLILLFFLFILTFSALAVRSNAKRHVVVLCYHHIVSDEEAAKVNNGAIISASEFKEQMKYLHDNGYYAATLSDMESFLYSKTRLPKRTVLITFDDGYESAYTYVYPILEEYGLHGVVFIIGSAVRTTPQEKGTLAMLSVDEIREMSKSGFIEFGSHTFNAHYFVKDKKSAFVEMDENELSKDFRDMDSFFEKIGMPKVLSIAYPYGQFNAKIVNEALVQGYKLGFTVNPGFVYQDSSPMTLNRMVIFPGKSLSEFKAMLRGRE